MRRLLRLAILLATLGAALAALWHFRADVLKAAAEAWAVNDPLARADAIVLLGGGLNNRPSEAARLYRQGVAPIILVSCPDNPGFVEAGYSPGEYAITLRILADGGVPPKAIVQMGTNNSSTFDEAVAFSKWAARVNPRSVLIPTDLFHTRRVKMIFDKVLGTNQVAIHPVVAPNQYKSSDWWRHERGLVDLNLELSKLLYYFWNY
jgi:uncharacterized SAM-binding protein YcdF (DUF218 family)